MDFLKVFVIISFIIVTIITLKFHPEMHHPLIIEDEHFKLTRISDNLPKSIPVNKTVNVQEIQTIPKQSEINIQQSTQQIITKPVQQTESRGIKTTNIDLTQSMIFKTMIFKTMIFKIMIMKKLVYRKWSF